MTIVLWFLFSLFLGFALHNIHAFHSRLSLFIFFQIKINKKKRKKKEANYVLHYFFLVFENKVGHFIFTYHVFCILSSFDELTYCTLLVEA